MKTSKSKKAKPSNKKQKKKYRIKNWSQYNESLKQRGSLEVWISDTALEKWTAQPTGKRGGQPTYSDFAIETAARLGAVFRQRLRQTEGLLTSIFKLMGITLQVPDYSTISRRSRNITVTLPKENKENVIAIIDSTGLKVYGEGEWKVRKHGYGKHRTWMKLHLVIDTDGEIRASRLTNNSISDAAVTPDMLEEEEDANLEGCAADGAYDVRDVYDLLREKNVPNVLIPPQRNAKIWQHGNSNAPPHPRDTNLRQIRKSSRKKWKEDVGYHVRSLAETAMFRFKTIFGDRLHARNKPQQITEALLKCSALNIMRTLGMPKSYASA